MIKFWTVWYQILHFLIRLWSHSYDLRKLQNICQIRNETSLYELYLYVNGEFLHKGPLMFSILDTMPLV